MNRIDIEATYNKWWKGKLVRTNDGLVKRVQKVVYYSSPSGVYGNAEFHFTDGSAQSVPQDRNSFRPRKKDVRVVEEVDK